MNAPAGSKTIAKGASKVRGNDANSTIRMTLEPDEAKVLAEYAMQVADNHLRLSLRADKRDGHIVAVALESK
jgi:hypothetical protein